MDHNGAGQIKAQYLRQLRIRATPETTQRTAKSVLTIVEHYAGKPLDECDHKDLERWQERRADEISPRSLRSQIGVVRACFKWAYLTGRRADNPAALLQAPRVPPTLPRPIPEGRLAKAYLAADARLRAILCLGAFAGLRATEIAALSWADVFLDDEAPHIYVMGKGRRERTVDLSPELVEVLKALPHRRGPVIRRADGNSGHNTPNNISKVVSRFFAVLGIPDTFHSTRHRAITEVVRVGGARQGQEFAGHAHMGTTSLYSKVLRTDLRPTVVAVGKLLTDRPQAS